MAVTVNVARIQMEQHVCATGGETNQEMIVDRAKSGT